MAKLILKYEAAVLKEVDVGAQPIGIGRAPDNALHVDNLAVSSHHARIFNDAGKLVVEDMNSLNGTFVNSQRVTRATLKPGDVVSVGKHSIEVRGEAEPLPAGAVPAAPAKPAPPKLQETMVLDTKKRRELLAQAMAAGGAPADSAGGATGTAVGTPAAPPRARIPWLIVLEGKTDQHEYMLSNKLTVIGKSAMATVRLKGWFAPKVAAQISKRDDGFYIGTGDKVPKVNGQAITAPTKLNEGDVIELGKVKLSFAFRD
ncbi:MAG TPA: FHA domain-containing protein [Candidatus Acidoferrales bacterium]|nr:FHA domain-containing protein [Candidatus Acidoferrales bacterium]